MAFFIDPGVHTINGRAVLDTTHCPLLSHIHKPGAAPDLEVYFEAGKTYYIGYDHSPDDSADWKLVVWKVEEYRFYWP